MNRALSSLESIIDVSSYNVDIIKDFAEIDLGAFSGKRASSLPKNLKDTRLSNKYEFRWPKGESM